jgi:hypothetical protein
VSAIESKIDELYQKPLGEFTAARNAFAKTLSGADASRVRALSKPTLVPWAVNLLYWHARATFDRLRKAGEKLRAAQIATLKGRAADVRAASEAHRKAIADAATQAATLAARAGAKPDADDLTRTLEALSIASELPEQPGRLSQPMKPAGFEALMGVPVAASKVKSEKLEVRKREKDREEQERKAREKAESEAAEALRLAAAAEDKARFAWERAKHEREAAERALDAARRRT